MTAATKRATAAQRELNAHIDVLDVLGLDAGTDWFLWRRPSNGQVELCLAKTAGPKLYDFIVGHPAVLDAVRMATVTA